MNEKKHECFVCGAKFPTWAELMQHIQDEAKKETYKQTTTQL